MSEEDVAIKKSKIIKKLKNENFELAVNSKEKEDCRRKLSVSKHYWPINKNEKRELEKSNRNLANERNTQAKQLEELRLKLKESGYGTRYNYQNQLKIEEELDETKKELEYSLTKL